MPAAAIDPEKVLRDLRGLWAQLAKDKGGPGGVLRACSMTLMVVAEPDDAADAESARKTIGHLMHGHPSRAIVLIPSRQARRTENEEITGVFMFEIQ